MLPTRQRLLSQARRHMQQVLQRGTNITINMAGCQHQHQHNIIHSMQLICTAPAAQATTLASHMQGIQRCRQPQCQVEASRHSGPSCAYNLRATCGWIPGGCTSAAVASSRSAAQQWSLLRCTHHRPSHCCAAPATPHHTTPATQPPQVLLGRRGQHVRVPLAVATRHTWSRHLGVRQLTCRDLAMHGSSSPYLYQNGYAS